MAYVYNKITKKINSWTPGDFSHKYIALEESDIVDNEIGDDGFVRTTFHEFGNENKIYHAILPMDEYFDGKAWKVEKITQ